MHCSGGSKKTPKKLAFESPKNAVDFMRSFLQEDNYLLEGDLSFAPVKQDMKLMFRRRSVQSRIHQGFFKVARSKTQGWK